MHDVMRLLAAGQLNAASIAIWTALSIVVAAVAGVISAVLLAGKSLGNDLAAVMGVMFGPVAAAPAVLLGLIVLAFI